MLEKKMNVYSIQISSVDFISIIRFELVDFAVMKTAVYYNYLLRTSMFSSNGYSF